MAWTWEDLSSDYEFINWLKSYFNENDDIKLFIQPDYVVYPPTVKIWITKTIFEKFGCNIYKYILSRHLWMK